MEKATSTSTASTCAQITVKILSIITRVTIMIFAGLAALCGAIAISKVEFTYIDDEAEILQHYSSQWEYAINFNVLLCSGLLLVASGGTLTIEIIMLVVSVIKKSSKAVVIVDTVLSSISAGVLFSLAVAQATVIDAHETQLRNVYRSSYSDYDYDYDSLYPSTVPGKGAAAFGFLAAFAFVGLIVLIWIKFCLEKRQSSD